MQKNLQILEQERQKLLETICSIGDMRRGSIVTQYQKCGKEPCCCKEEGHSGHGPYHLYTTKKERKTKSIHLSGQQQIKKFKEEIENFQKFKEVSKEFVDVNEEICNLKPVKGEDNEDKSEIKKKLKKIFKRKSEKK